jgi:hypothetical protein
MNLLDWIGNWNPQLERELRGKLKPWQLAGAIALSLIGQWLFILLFQARLPNPEISSKATHLYCAGKFIDGDGGKNCIRDLSGHLLVNWPLWWSDFFNAFTLSGLFVLLLGGIVLITHNLSKEEQRGTLNFIRLSPSTTGTILWGKLLGVPAWLYVAVFTAVPLHLWIAVQAQVPLDILFSIYAVAIAGCGFFYSLVLLWSLTTAKWGGFVTWLGTAAIGLLLLLMLREDFSPANLQSIKLLYFFIPWSTLRYLNQPSWSAQLVESYFWFGLPVAKNSLILTFTAICNYGVWTYWVWQGLKRCFRSPNATVFSKSQSYALVCCFEAIMIGFLWTPSTSTVGKGLSASYFYSGLAMTMLFFLGLILMLSPNRQTLQDWARYRHQQPAAAQRHHLLSDLLFGEKSPALLAIAVNSLIAAGFLLLPCLRQYLDSSVLFDEFLTAKIFQILLTLSMVLIYAAIVQLILMQPITRRWTLALGSFAILVFLPPVTAAASKQPVLLLFSVFPFTSFNHGLMSSAFTTLLTCFFGQLALFSLGSAVLTQQLRQAGSSASKPLFAATKSNIKLYRK